MHARRPAGGRSLASQLAAAATCTWFKPAHTHPQQQPTHPLVGEGAGALVLVVCGGHALHLLHRRLAARAPHQLCARCQPCVQPVVAVQEVKGDPQHLEAGRGAVQLVKVEVDVLLGLRQQG